MTKIADQLTESIPRECISEKQGLSYVSHRYVKSQLNAIFGWHGWSYEVIRTDIDREHMGAFTHVRLTVMGPEGPVIKDGLAFGFLPKPHKKTVEEWRADNQGLDFALAESLTDAIKRAAVSLGERLGLELYPMTKGGNVPQPGPAKEQPLSESEVKEVKGYADMIGTCEKPAALDVIGGLIRASSISRKSKDGLGVLYVAKKKELEVSDE